METPAPQRATARRFAFFSARQRRLAALVGAAIVLVVAGWALAPAPRGLTEAQVKDMLDAEFEERRRPSAADAYAAIRPAVVQVQGWPAPGKGDAAKGGEDEGSAEPASTGTGVVIVDSGIILTNLHVVADATRVTVTFAGGLESEALLVGARPEHDLAVLRARTLPDDLVAATMRATGDLRPGDPVVAVGYPFGIGPSASAGVVSGLRRDYISPEGGRVLSNLIQFDAAVNPGNSGGPLVTEDGHVVGIVTGLLNPTEDRVFVGIGFAVPIENAAGAAGLNPF